MSRTPDKHLALVNALEELKRCRTERDDALEAVDELQRQLADSQALTRVGTWRRTVETDHLYWSDQTYRIHGLKPGEPLDREKVINLIHENDRDRVREEFDAAIQDRRSFRLIYRIRRPDGKVRVLQADNMISSDAPGGEDVVHGAIHDITESPLPETPAAHSDSRLPRNSVLVDQEGIIVRHSGSFNKVLVHLEAGSSIFQLFESGESHDRLADALDAIEKDMAPRVVRLVPDALGHHEHRTYDILPWPPVGKLWGFILTDRGQDDAEDSTVVRSFAPGSIMRQTVGAWERDMTTGAILWTRGMYDIVERDPSLEPLSREAFRSLILDEDLQEFDRLSTEFDRTKLPIVVAGRIRVPSGRVKTITIQAEYSTRTGTHSHIIGTLTDVSGTDDLRESIRRAELKEQRMRYALSNSRHQLMAASLRLQQAQESERMLIAQELHDEAGGLLTALNLTLNQLGDPADDEIKTKARDLLDQLTEQIRSTSRKLRPSVLDSFGLVPGLKQLAEDMATLGDWKLDLDLQPDEADIPEGVSNVLYGIAREAMLNALKHAEAARLSIRLTARGDGFELTVEDDGIGLGRDTSGDASGMGLKTMRDRAESHGGWLRVTASEGEGARITAFVPA